MTKEALLIEFMMVIAAMQNVAVDLVEDYEYSNFDDFMEDIFANLGNEEKSIQSTTSNLGYVQRESVMQGIGDGQALSIFPEPVKFENEEF